MNGSELIYVPAFALFGIIEWFGEHFANPIILFLPYVLIGGAATILLLLSFIAGLLAWVVFLPIKIVVEFYILHNSEKLVL